MRDSARGRRNREAETPPRSSSRARLRDRSRLRFGLLHLMNVLLRTLLVLRKLSAELAYHRWTATLVYYGLDGAECAAIKRELKQHAHRLAMIGRPYLH